jgi:hypothetical protein
MEEQYTITLNDGKMKIIYRFFVFSTLIFLLDSCSQNKFWVAPKFTDVSKIATLKKGMTKEDVSLALGIEAYDSYFMDASSEMLIYNYRLQERRIPVSNSGRYVNMDSAPMDRTVNSEIAQNQGSLYYTEWRRLYVSFQDNKMVSMITEGGMENANSVLILASSIQSIQKNPDLKVVPYKITDDNFVVPLDEKGNYISNNGSVINGSTPNGYIIGGAQVATIPHERNFISGNAEYNVIYNNKRFNKRYGYRTIFKNQRK